MHRAEPRWTQQDELLASVSESVDAWSRIIVHAVQFGPVKQPKLPPSMVKWEHPARQSKPPAPTAVEMRPRDEDGRVPVAIDPAAARRFFN